MPKETDYKKAIPNLYKRGFLESSIFSWINALKYTMPHLSLDQCLNGFYKFYGINEEEYQRKTAIQTYERMTKELIKKQSDENRQKN